MSKIRVYREKSAFEDVLEITSSNVSHKLKSVLRVKEGADIYIFDGAGCECRYRVRTARRTALALEKIGHIQSEKEDTVKVILGFPLMRESKVDLLLQKATELGAWGFAPFISQHSLVNVRTAKIERWRTIVIEAARQSDRVWVPFIEEPIKLTDLAEKDFDIKLYGHRDGMRISDIDFKSTKRVCVLIGPEGDFSDQERRQLESWHYRAVALSRNILRAETAALFSVGVLKNICNES